MADMPAGRCSGNLFLWIAKGLWTTRRTPGPSCPSAKVQRQGGRLGVTPKRAPTLTSNGRPSRRRFTSTRFGQSMGCSAKKYSWRVRPGPLATVKNCVMGIQGCQPSVMAVRPRQSDGDTAGIRNREVLANEETGKVPGLFVQRFDYGIDG